MENKTIPQFWLKIIKPDQLDKLQNEHKSGLTWGNCLRAKVVDGNDSFKFYDTYGKVLKGDKFVFYVMKSNIISHLATVSEKPDWDPKINRDAFMKAHKGKPDEEWEWVHKFEFTDIQPITNPINLSRDKDKIPFLRRFKNHGTAFMNCSMWKLTQEDYNAVVSD